jgi:superfamily I DNA/RNA helicase
MHWIRALDAGVADVIANALEDAVRVPPQDREHARREVPTRARTAEQDRALQGKWAALQRSLGEVASWLRKRERSGFRVEGLAVRLDEPREHFARELEADPAWKEAKNADLRQSVQNSLRRRLTHALQLHSAYERALRSPSFLVELTAATGSDAQQAVEGACAAIAKGKLTDAALDALLVIAHAVSLGYTGSIEHLAETPRYTQVFIDEYQDFSEAQLFLMGAHSDPAYRVVTLVGDLRQQLRSARQLDLAACFPLASKDERVPAMLLENKRQSGPLARLSQRFREEILGDGAVRLSFASDGPLPRLLTVTPDHLVEAVEDEVLRIPRGASVAVICASPEVARDLERKLREPLTSRFRETLLSSRSDLTRRFFVHFTTALDAKGLEFDAVVVPLLDQLEAWNHASLNAAYVALSRPKRHLSIIAAGETTASTFANWAAEGLLEVGAIGQHDLAPSSQASPS